MTRSGFYKTHSDGMTTFSQTSEGNNHSNHHMLKADEMRQKEREYAARHFIPSYEFVGPEKPLSRAMRLLATYWNEDGFNYHG